MHCLNVKFTYISALKIGASGLRTVMARVFLPYKLNGLAHPVSNWCAIALLCFPSFVIADDINALKAQALRLDVAAQRLVNNAHYKDAVRLKVLVANSEDGWLVNSIRLTVDDVVDAQYDYSLKEALSLSDGALHQLTDERLQVGRHQIKAQVTLFNADSLDTETLQLDQREKPDWKILELDEVVSFSLENPVLVLDVKKPSFLKVLRSPRLQLSDITRKYSEPGNTLLRLAQFEMETGKPFSGLSYVLLSLAAEPSAGISQAIRQKILNAAADLGITAQGFPLPLAQTETAIGDDYGSDEPYRQYNQAVSQFRSGDVNNALTTFHAISALGSNRPDLLLLKDKVNLGLGFYYLDHLKYKTAARYFSNVRRFSPYASQAVVGLGWSRLIPDDVDQQLADELIAGDRDDYIWFESDDDIAKVRRTTPFRHSWSVVYGEKRKDLMNAIEPWMTLLNGDPLDIGVQEGMLAIPYAMAHLGDIDQAISYYQAANEKLTTVLAFYDNAITRVRSGELSNAITQAIASDSSGWDNWLCALLADKSNRYIGEVIGSHAVISRMHKFSQLSSIYQTLHSDRQKLLGLQSDDERVELLVMQIDSNLAPISIAREQTRRQFEQAVSDALMDKRKLAEQYLAESGFALARIYENPRKELASGRGEKYRGEAR